MGNGPNIATDLDRRVDPGYYITFGNPELRQRSDEKIQAYVGYW